MSCFPDRLPRNASQAYDAVVFAEESDRSQLIEEASTRSSSSMCMGRAVSSPRHDDGDDAYDAVVLADARDITTPPRARRRRRAQDATGRPAGLVRSSASLS